MLYQLSYASSRVESPLKRRHYPLVPFLMSGTIYKTIITASHVQPPEQLTREDTRSMQQQLLLALPMLSF
jgi:hypothetical protein